MSNFNCLESIGWSCEEIENFLTSENPQVRKLGENLLEMMSEEDAYIYDVFLNLDRE